MNLRSFVCIKSVRYLVLIVFFDCLKCVAGENHAIFHVNGCNDGQFYDTASLSCRPCGSTGGENADNTRQTTSADGLSCVCRFGYRLIGYTQSGGILCAPCAQDEVSSMCAVCESNTGNSSDGTCQSCGSGQISLVRNVDGSFMASHKCVTCKAGTQASPSGDRCVPCLDDLVRTGQKSCDCPEKTHEMTGGLCFKRSDLKEIPDQTSLYTVKYDHQELESAFFCRHIRSAVVLCQLYGNMTACQLLGNLCVLSMYRRVGDVQNACTRYLRILAATGVNIPAAGIVSASLNAAQQAASRVPWLYYQYESVEETTKKKDVEATYSFKKKNKNSRLNLTAATYSADGKFLGISPLSGRSLQLCGGPFGVLDRALDYGTFYSRKCRIPVKDLFNMKETVFYDPYLYYEIAGKSPVLYAVPVVVRNYLENGQLINRGSNTQWKFVRRYFLVDNVSGRTPCHTTSNMPAIIRYAKDITVRVEMYRFSREAGRIYPPLIIIDYAEATLEDLGSEEDVEVSFSVTYKMDKEKEERDYSIAIGVLTAVGVLNSVIQTWSWSKRSGRLAVDFLSLIKFLIFCCGNLSSIFFTVTFLTCFYIFVFFKGQEVVYLILPTSDQETLFIVMIVVAFFLKAIQLIHNLVLQVLVDIFFVDWERPRPRRTLPHPSDVSAPHDDSVSIWRTYLVANEWAELQATRYTSIGVQLFATVFLLTVVGFENLASAAPSSNVSESQFEYRSPDSTVCRMALAIAIYLGVAVVQCFFLKYVYERLVEDKIRQFIDLCSISNISVFLMTHCQFGHYIHGRSVHGHADTDMKSMHEQLRREEDNLCSQRGLLANSDQQTFHIALPAKLRSYYDHVMAPLIRTNQLPGRLVASSSPTHGAPGTNLLTPLDCSIQAYQTMNKFLASFLEHALRDLDYIVKDRLFVENLLDIEFQDPTDKGFFYIDNGHSYDAALLCGEEVTLVMFDLLLFVCVDLIAKNFILASVVTFVVSKIFHLSLYGGLPRVGLPNDESRKTALNSRQGSSANGNFSNCSSFSCQFIIAVYRAAAHRNLARKTLVDSRFLI